MTSPDDPLAAVDGGDSAPAARVRDAAPAANTDPAVRSTVDGRWPGIAARAEGRTLRIGHKGADAVVPGNTLESLVRAVELGADVVEFDAFPDADGTLRLAHDAHDLAARPDAPTVDAAIERLCWPEVAHVGLNLDSKSVGDEPAIVAALRRHDVVDRTLVSTMETPTLRALRELEPALRLGRSVPRITHDWYGNPLTRPAVIGWVLAMRRALPPLLVRELRRGRIDAVMAHWGLITPRFARTITMCGELYAWTVDDPGRARALAEVGVTGITSNDPRWLRW